MIQTHKILDLLYGNKDALYGFLVCFIVIVFPITGLIFRGNIKKIKENVDGINKIKARLQVVESSLNLLTKHLHL